MTGLELGRLVGAIRFIGIAIIIGCTVLALAGCRTGVSETDQIRIDARLEVMYQLAAIPMPKPEILYAVDYDWRQDALMSCFPLRITFSYRVAAENLDFLLDKVIPHEYAHVMSCYYRGGFGDEPHDDWWKAAVRRLGGDPNYI